MKSYKNSSRKEISDATKNWLESGKKITVCPPRKARGHQVARNRIEPIKAIDTSALPSSLKIRFGIK